MAGKRFVVMVGDIEPVDQDRVTEYLKGKVGWWHHLPFSWLVASSDEAMTSKSLRDGVRTAVPGGDVLVVELGAGSDWAIWGPVSQADWLKRNWPHG